MNQDQLNYISEKVDIHWKRLARSLEIEDKIIDNIEVNRDLSRFEDKCWQIFKKDKGQVGRQSLNSSLDDIGKSNLKIESQTNQMQEESKEIFD